MKKRSTKSKPHCWQSSDYALSHVSPAQPGWRLVRIGYKNRMVLEPIAAFAFGTETRFNWTAPRIGAKGKKRVANTFPAVGVLAFAPGDVNAGINLLASVTWLGGEYDWLFDEMIAGICAPGLDPRPMFREALTHLKKYQG